ncbi:hypothetical protein C8R44DRAFT_736644 [Mycena epipterygia]|nr:hypothetical protein C8R44DRAFT_736644 [Mycena epipterygia]
MEMNARIMDPQFGAGASNLAAAKRDRYARNVPIKAGSTDARSPRDVNCSLFRPRANRRVWVHGSTGPRDSFRNFARRSMILRWRVVLGRTLTLAAGPGGTYVDDVQMKLDSLDSRPGEAGGGIWQTPFARYVLTEDGRRNRDIASWSLSEDE